MKKGLALWAAAVLLAGTMGCGRTEAAPQETAGTESGIQKQEQLLDEAASGASEAEETAADAGQDAAGTEPGREGGSQGAEGSGTDEMTENQEAENDAEEEAALEALLENRPKVRGIYVTGPMAGTSGMDKLIELVERTELNALVIDIKNDEGYVTCELDAPLTEEIGSVKRYIRDMPALVQKCKEKGIYLIARVVAFRDPLLAEAKPEWSLHNADGSIFRDKSGLAWVNPYEEQVWEYLVQVAEGAVALGFNEVQFDYIRFSTDSGMKQVDFGEAAQEKSKTEVITEFAAFAAKRLHDTGAAVSADVYGVVIDSGVDQQIVGQDYVALAEHLDYLSPMVYPSHYGPYNYDIPIPDAQPYETVLAAMQASKQVLSGVLKVEAEAQETGATASGNEAEGTDATVSGNKMEGTDATVSGNEAQEMGASVSGNEAEGTGVSAAGKVAAGLTADEIAALAPMKNVRAKVRPWLQDFTATWVAGHIKYGPEQIRDQIQAVYDAGYEEWILWNAANRYTEGGLYGADGLPVEESLPEESTAAGGAAEGGPADVNQPQDTPADDGQPKEEGSMEADSVQEHPTGEELNADPAAEEQGGA